MRAFRDAAMRAAAFAAAEVYAAAQRSILPRRVRCLSLIDAAIVKFIAVPCRSRPRYVADVLRTSSCLMPCRLRDAMSVMACWQRRSAMPAPPLLLLFAQHLPAPAFNAFFFFFSRAVAAYRRTFSPPATSAGRAADNRVVVDAVLAHIAPPPALSAFADTCFPQRTSAAIIITPAADACH